MDYEVKGEMVKELIIDQKDITFFSDEEKENVVERMNYKKQKNNTVIFIILGVIAFLALVVTGIMADKMPVYLEMTISIALVFLGFISILMIIVSTMNKNTIERVNEGTLCYFIAEIAGKNSTPDIGTMTPDYNVFIRYNGLVLDEGLNVSVEFYRELETDTKVRVFFLQNERNSVTKKNIARIEDIK